MSFLIESMIDERGDGGKLILRDSISEAVHVKAHLSRDYGTYLWIGDKRKVRASVVNKKGSFRKLNLTVGKQGQSPPGGIENLVAQLN